MKKLKNCRGESLSETLIAVLIIALAAGLLAGGATSTVKINQRAAQSNEIYFQELSQAEVGDVTGQGVAQVRLGNQFYQMDIALRGQEDGLRSYDLEGAP